MKYLKQCIYCHENLHTASSYQCNNHKHTIYYDYDRISFAFNDGAYVCIINYFNNTIKICDFKNASFILKLNYLTYISPETISLQFKSWMPFL